LAIWTSNFAEVHLTRKHFAKAEPLYLRATEIMKAARGTESGEYGTSLSNLGALYGLWAQEPGEAARRAQESEFKTKEFSICIAARGPRHPATAISHNNLAVMNADADNWPGAAVEMGQAVSIMLSLDLADHPNTQSFARGLALFWIQSGQRGKAERLRRGDPSDLLPVIRAIEAEHRAWVAENPENRRFGPPSPFAGRR